ncbi:hypothetical protein HDE68_005037 [Pedobacter cryoconitis]|uniref:Uncharacterized protein n=1 Tax=Pedobacter cryoconitis TaxID=188932 RepID=A0A7W9E2A1_9SPHI|nr:hypothetical protein [Pedobacter cryoconitis]
MNRKLKHILKVLAIILTAASTNEATPLIKISIKEQN